MSKIRSLAEVEPREVEWLLFPYIPRGNVTMLCSEPDVGKSNLTLAISRAVASGEWECLPNTHDTTPENVLLLSAEDGTEETIKPRLERAGTPKEVQARIFAFEGNLKLDKKGVKELETLIHESEASLVVIDPLSSYVPSHVNQNNSSPMRELVDKLAEIAKSANCAIVIVRHFNKKEGGSLISRASGSVELIAGCRSALTVMKDQKTGVSTLFHIKHNLSGEGTPLDFHVTGDGFRWIGESSKTLEQFEAMRSGDSAQDDGVRFLEYELVHGTETSAVLNRKFCDHHSGARATLYRSKKAMGVESVDVVAKNGARETHWKLPEGYKFRFYTPPSQPLETETETANVVVSNLVSNTVSNLVSSRAKLLQETESSEVPQLADSEILEIANAPFLI